MNLQVRVIGIAISTGNSSGVAVGAKEGRGGEEEEEGDRVEGGMKTSTNNDSSSLWRVGCSPHVPGPLGRV